MTDKKLSGAPDETEIASVEAKTAEGSSTKGEGEKPAKSPINANTPYATQARPDFTADPMTNPEAFLAGLSDEDREQYK